MSWVAIFEADVLTHISGSELAALRTAALASGQVDPVQPSIDQITSLVRGFVEACADNKVDTDLTTIPDRLLATACDLVVCEIITRVPGYALDEDRAEKKKNAISLLRDVGACKFRVTDPVTGSGATGSLEVTGYTVRQTTRAQMSGL